MTGPHKHSDPTHQPRRDRMYEEHVQDPYLSRGKPPEPSACPDCGAVFHKGRWQWGEKPDNAHAHRCPACSRIHDRVPAGELILEGDFFAGHREEITHLIRHIETKEKGEHPLERIMDARDEGGRHIVTFTSQHITRGAGDAVHHAYQGKLEIRASEKDGMLRITWRR